ncbi:short integuments 2, mitochondrial-like isoform X3 [Actinidia eriantha]|uniref:short integuments 2, mitochondrial-like isoform X3 n=1 Tax=Actinidia eriantha TaxID=165200 RepID=UPI00258F1790|nr:short integuments 2, mitochondrial-like isoform X3 [Actinidia eriantha]XP_057467478.1 short integuments 2, mitochondrial-like isoform X3 [Actinidia eriantha]
MRFNLEGGAINWFPGHMGAATRAIGDRLKLSDIVIEVHDVRVYPPRRPHSNLLCKHKSPTNAHRQKKWIHYFHSHNQDCLSINAHNKDSVKKLLDLVEFKLKEVISREPTLLAMVVGVPNGASQL